MFKIIFLNLFFFIYNLYQLEIPYAIDFFQNKNKNEFIFISTSAEYVDDAIAYTLDIKTDSITLVDEKELNGVAKDFHIFENELIIYSFYNRAIIDYKGKNKTIYMGQDFSERFVTQAYGNNILLFCSSHYTSGDSPYYLFHIDMFLNLVKKPYGEISKTVMIEFDTSDNFIFNLMALKDCFLFIKSEYLNEGRGNSSIKIVDYELNSINNITIEFEKCSYFEYSQLSEKGNVNEFILCANYIDETEIKCKIIKYEKIKI